MAWVHRLSDIDLIAMTATCANCGPVKLHPHRGKHYCFKAFTARNRENNRRERQKRMAAKRAVLGDCCEICGSTEKLRWDHCHEAGTFRGTLCHWCNTGLGMFKDSEALLDSAKAYLSKANPKKGKDTSLLNEVEGSASLKRA